MQSNYLLVPWNRWKQEKKNSLREAPARLLAFQCQPHTAVHIVSLILWNMYFVLFSYLFADKANVSCRLPPRWAPTELGLVHPTSNLTTSPGTNYLRALTCRPLMWGSVTLPTAWSYCTSQPECYIFSNFRISCNSRCLWCPSWRSPQLEAQDRRDSSDLQPHLCVCPQGSGQDCVWHRANFHMKFRQDHA